MKTLATNIGSGFMFLWVFAIHATVESSAQSTVNPTSSQGSTASAPTGKAPVITPNALPYTLEFVEKKYSAKKPLPRLQSYSLFPSASGEWIVIGGRRQGLHTFQSAPATNFIPDSANNFIFVINPANGKYWSFDVNKLPANLSAPLQATNQQFYYDPATDQAYILGGYGLKADKSNMITFNTLIRFKVSSMNTAIKKGQSAGQIAALIEFAQDSKERFAVTGGELLKMGSNFYLVMGQRFDGQYRAFGQSDFQQEYTEAVGVFSLVPDSLKINSYGQNPVKTGDQPFHRRDGNFVHDMDPVTGKPRIAVFGGVFKPGIIGAYTYPIYINNPSTPTIVRNANQKFSQYTCPVITVYDSSKTKSVYHTFFGGISHHYYAQTKAQKAVYDSATFQKRNDGFPFIADITTFLQSSSGTYSEFIHPNPTPGNRLIGTSSVFVLHPSMASKGYVFENGVINLAKIPLNKRLLVGYMYGGIEAQNPLPSKPNTGTFVSNSIIEIYLTYKPFGAISADQAHPSVAADANLRRE